MTKREEAATFELASPRDVANILLVEDDTDLRHSFAEYLRLRGHSVTEAASGLEFYRALRGSTFDIAILDVNLPDCSGFDLAEDLGADAGRVGIVMLTARTGQDDRILGYERGADLYLTKPVDGDELSLAIRNLLRRLPEPAAPVDRPRGEAWLLDRLGYSLASPNGMKFNLTGREMQLLVMLAEAGGKPVSRAELSVELGYEERPDGRGIDAILQRLKQKTMAAKTELPVKAIRSVGISFAAQLETR